jgi:protoheme IX farnesyltransferase
LDLKSSLVNYWELTKPKIWSLLVFTGVSAMLVAYHEVGRTPSVLSLLLGGLAITFGSAAANTLTNYHDRDIDKVMHRTHNRPLPSGRIDPPSKALVFGLVLGALSILFSLFFNVLAAAFMVVGLVDNIVVYSLILKRRSWLNIILGGISGGMPVLVGYSAIAGSVSPIALFLSALVIVWIPTHIWSLAIRSEQDYRQARVPMLPVVFGRRIASVCIAFTSALLAVFSLGILLFATVSIFYLISAMVLGGWVMAYSLKLAIDKKAETAWTLFKITSPYLALIFTALILDVWLF